MNDAPILVPFQYPRRPHVRRHGPQGYSVAQQYKPWLRDEFTFRCVYCLTRERWCPDGEDVFGVEHAQPEASNSQEVSNYRNLLYACCRCNAAKRDLTGILNPAEVSLAEHLEILTDGTIHGLTDDGWDLIRVCQLDRPNLVAFRHGILEILQTLGDLRQDAQRRILRRYFGFPSNLPRLTTLRPPGGNLRPEGIADSYYERRRKGRLPEFY